MLKYFLRKIGWLLLILLSAITITFILSRIVPADPARLAAGLMAEKEQVEQVRKEMGLDQPLPTQYFRYISGLVRFDFGRSIQSRGPVLEDLKVYLPATLELVVFTFALYSFLGVALGLVWAMWPTGIIGYTIKFITTAGVAIPVFWAGLIGQIIFANKLRLLPVAGRIGIDLIPSEPITGLYVIDSLLRGDLDLLISALSHLVLPVFSLVLFMLPVAARLTRTSVTAELKKDYVRTARGKGIPEPKVMVNHVLKNSLNPVISMLGLQFGWLLGGTIMVEVVFSWPGIGTYLYNSFRTFDYDPIMSITILVTVAFVFVNTVVDLLYPVLDPRIGAE